MSSEVPLRESDLQEAADEGEDRVGKVVEAGEHGVGAGALHPHLTGRKPAARLGAAMGFGQSGLSLAKPKEILRTLL